jgi:hypothetical protein
MSDEKPNYAAHAKAIRAAIKELNNVLKDAAMVGITVLIERHEDGIDSTKVSFDQYGAKRIYFQEDI